MFTPCFTERGRAIAEVRPWSLAKAIERKAPRGKANHG
ncbi:hypothetical protein J2T05_002512 [Cupriavidus necator]|nr:hypothetical protein [Cupriavidus necator]